MQPLGAAQGAKAVGSGRSAVARSTQHGACEFEHEAGSGDGAPAGYAAFITAECGRVCRFLHFV